MNQKVNVQTEINSLSVNLRQKNKRTNEDYPGLTVAVCQNTLVPALDAGPQKNKPYQSVVYTVGFNAIPRQAREQDRLRSLLTFNYLGGLIVKNAFFSIKRHPKPNKC